MSSPKVCFFSLCSQRSWTYVKKCKNNMRPNRALVAQLSEWEKVVLGDAVTDILDPLY